MPSPPPIPPVVGPSGGGGYAAPLLLLPVRLETRFMDAPGGRELWLRVFPDQISVNTHEPKLTTTEVELAEDYWRGVWRVGTTKAAEERRPWERIAARLGARRAAWVVSQHTPNNAPSRPTAPTPDDKQLPVEPTFDAVDPNDIRPASWSEPARAGGLPAGFVVGLIPRSGPTRFISFDNPVAADLQLGPDPSSPLDPNAPSIDPADLQADEGLRWMVDFDAAVAAGMGQRLTISDEERRAGFARIVVFGVSEDSGGTAFVASDSAEVEALLEAHHYTDGLAILRQGSPTNNTPDVSSAYTRQDPGADRSFATERGGPITPIDGARLAEFIGIDPSVFEHVENADSTESADAKAMAVALWTSTGGYFLTQIMRPVFSRDQEERAREWFRDAVRARGPLPALRVADAPYGVLPVTSLAQWADPDASPFQSGLTQFLRNALPLWKSAAHIAPHTGGPGDANDQLDGWLRRDASSQSYQGRHVLGPDFAYHAGAWLEVDGMSEQAIDQTAIGQAQLHAFGYDNWDPRVIHMYMSSVHPWVKRPTVQDEPLSETDGLADSAGNYIKWLAQATIEDVRNDATAYPGGAPPTSLLYAVLRQSVLLENALRAFEALRWSGEESAYLGEEEFTGFNRIAESPTPWEVLDRVLDQLTGQDTLAQWLDAHRRDGYAPRGVSVNMARLAELYEALDLLGELTSAELERLFAETMDTLSHRLDPWITALATDRLRQWRDSGSTMIRLGAYGWLEDVGPGPEGTPPTNDELDEIERLDTAYATRHPTAPERRNPIAPRSDNGGYIHAPSATQAAAGAVLRSGYLADRGLTSGGPMAIDLSSDRVRTALWLLEGVREGQELGALLGYRFEHTLHDAGEDAQIQPLRDSFPLVANKLTEPAASTEAVAAANVVDGLALQRAYAGGDLDTGGMGDGLIAALDHLNGAFDAIADLSLAESVFQLVRGNHTRAGGILDAVSRGDRPPVPEIVDTPRSARSVSHRLMLLATGTPTRDASWGGDTRERAKAEPVLDAWLSGQLPSDAACTVSGTVGGASQSVTVPLSDLDIGPLDVLALAGASDQPQASELEQRLVAASGLLEQGAQDLAIDYSTHPAGTGSFPDLLLCARAARELVGGARPLRPGDLIEPPRRALAVGRLDLVELAGRADGTVGAVGQIAGRLANSSAALAAAPTDPQALADALADLEAARDLGAQGAVPTSLAPADVAAQAKRVGEALAKRASDLADFDAKLDRTTATDDRLRDHLLQLARQAFGGEFTMLPQFAPPDGQALHDAFADSAAIVIGHEAEPSRWLTQVTHVQAGAARFENHSLLAQGVVGAAAPKLTLGQLPRLDLTADPRPDRWIALPFDESAGERPPADGRVAIAAVLTGTYSKAQPHCGLMLDDWQERIPLARETTGLAFHYAQPMSRAPQALLLAVAPDTAKGWSQEALLAVLEETMDLAAVRTVTAGDLSEGGQVLPAAYFAFNPDDDTVSTNIVDWE